MLPVRKVLSRLRCINDSTTKLLCKEPLPESLCYAPSYARYEVNASNLPNPLKFPRKYSIYESKSTSSTVVAEIDILENCLLNFNSKELHYKDGVWMYLVEFSHPSSESKLGNFRPGWIFISNNRFSHHYLPLVKVKPAGNRVLNSWLEVVEYEYGGKLNGFETSRVPACSETVDLLRHAPEQWTIEHDTALISLIYKQTISGSTQFGNARQYLEDVELSSVTEQEDMAALFDDDSATYWESNGAPGQHWIRLTLKRNVVIAELSVTVDSEDDSYCPAEIEVHAGMNASQLEKITEAVIDTSFTGDFTVLADCHEYYRVIELRIRRCKDGGIDTRIHALRLVPKQEAASDIFMEIFAGESLHSVPLLQDFDCEQIYWRANALIRLVSLVDSVMGFVVPHWQHSVQIPTDLESLRSLLLLSKKRDCIIKSLLTQTEIQTAPNSRPRVLVDRRLALEHRQSPWLDPSCQHTVFFQIYSSLHSSLKSSAIDQHYLTFRWPVSFDQWWECKFIAEGMIDQGGGFRESLSDLSEELCPPDPSNPVPLPFFVRSPNQQQNDNNVFRDCFVPNPACKDLLKYEFVGKLMGACFRGREQLALDLAPWVWKKLVGQKISWVDFATVDAAEVKAMQAIEHADRETFEQLGRTWSCVASDGKLVELRPEGSKTPVSFEERRAFVEQVKLKRMSEDDEQLSALRRGLLQTVPAAVLALMEWSEVERKICGIAEVTTEELKKHVRIGSFSPGDSRVQCLWEVLNGFTNEERSRFLRFVTGRRRLPVMIYVEPATDEGADGFPTSSTCCNLLFLPRYSTAKKAEEKIRYAIQNCVAIDTDINDI